MYDKTGVLQDRREMLRVKAKSLADEARTIRLEEKRTFGQLQQELHRHRVMDVREHARATYLAYGLIRGTPLEKIETSETRSEPLWKKVRHMVEKYGPLSAESGRQVLDRCKD